jgi:hypothetical protein
MKFTPFDGVALRAVAACCHVVRHRIRIYIIIGFCERAPVRLRAACAETSAPW